jgi:hypothetical protein
MGAKLESCEDHAAFAFGGHAASSAYAIR